MLVLHAERWVGLRFRNATVSCVERRKVGTGRMLGNCTGSIGWMDALIVGCGGLCFCGRLFVVASEGVSGRPVAIRLDLTYTT